MTFSRTTAFGTSYGNVTDDERLQVSQGMNNQNLAAQMQALQMEIADRQAGRQFNAGENDKTRQHDLGLFDRKAGLDLQLDDRSTARQIGITDRQMAPSLMDAKIREREANVDLPIKEARGQYQLQALKNAMEGSGAAGAPGSGMDAEAAMFMAWGGNPGEYLREKRAITQADRTHQDAEDTRNFDLAKTLIASGKPEAVALGIQILSKIKSSGLGGADPATLQTALQPEVGAADAIAKSPAIQLVLDNAATLLTKASSVGGDVSQIEQAKPLIAQVVTKLQQRGVRPEEAQAFITNEMRKRLPANTTFADDLLEAVFTAGIGSAITAGADDRTRAARQAAGLVD